MKKIIVYLIFLALLDIFGIVFLQTGSGPSWLQGIKLIALCGLVGGLGGEVYCLRGVYLNASVRKAWDDEWQPWYYIRPIVSHLCGAISYLFLKAGLLLLEAKKLSDSTDLGFLALAFIAGLNVDKFITKIEDLAHATWGIEKSRTSRVDKSNGN